MNEIVNVIEKSVNITIYTPFAFIVNYFIDTIKASLLFGVLAFFGLLPFTIVAIILDFIYQLIERIEFSIKVSDLFEDTERVWLGGEDSYEDRLIKLLGGTTYSLDTLFTFTGESSDRWGFPSFNNDLLLGVYADNILNIIINTPNNEMAKRKILDTVSFKLKCTYHSSTPEIFKIDYSTKIYPPSMFIEVVDLDLVRSILKNVFNNNIKGLKPSQVKTLISKLEQAYGKDDPTVDFLREVLHDSAVWEKPEDRIFTKRCFRTIFELDKPYIYKLKQDIIACLKEKNQHYITKLLSILYCHELPLHVWFDEIDHLYYKFMDRFIPKFENDLENVLNKFNDKFKNYKPLPVDKNQYSTMNRLVQLFYIDKMLILPNKSLDELVNMYIPSL